MRIDLRASGEQLLKHHITLEGTAFVTAVALGPGHAQPAAFAQLAAEFRVGAIPVFRAFVGRVVLQCFGDKFAHFGP
ncbi:hypothetical protein D3C75_1282870 [compost metagenome]